MKTWDVPVMTCPHCCEPHDCMTDPSEGSAGRRAPKTGELGVCIACGKVNVVVGPGELRRATFAELQALTPRDLHLLQLLERLIR